MTFVRSTMRMPLNAPAMIAPSRTADSRAACVARTSQEGERFACYAKNTMSPLCKTRSRCSDGTEERAGGDAQRRKKTKRAEGDGKYATAVPDRRSNRLSAASRPSARVGDLPDPDR